MKIKNSMVERKDDLVVERENNTNTRIFMLPALEINKQELISNGFINAYLGDDGYDVVYKDCLYLLFKPEFGERFESFIKYLSEKVKIVDEYDAGKGLVMIVIKFPSYWIKDFKFFKQGKYSKLSKSFIHKYFPFKKPVQWDGKGNVVQEEYTLFYHIFHRSDWLKEWWAERLGYEKEDFDDFKLTEYWDKPEPKREVFRHKE